MALGISVVMLVFTFGKVHLHPLSVAWRFDPRELWAVLAARPWAFVLVGLLEGLQLPLRAWLWRYVLPKGTSTQGARYHAIALGALAQNVLPARAGELVRGLSLSQHCSGLGRTRSLTTVATSKLAELAALLTFVALAPLTVDLAKPELATFRHGAWVGGIVLVALVTLFVLLTRARGRAHHIESALRHLPGKLGCKLAVGIDELAHGAAAVGSLPRGLMAYLAALATVGIAVAAFMAGMWGVGAEHSFGAATVVLGAVSLGMSIPSSPSGVGVFHLVCVYAMTALGVEAPRAAAFALALHLVGTSVNIGMGLISLMRGHESLGALRGEQPKPVEVEPSVA
ncbi:MAG: flippase-like domain-containing protein [Deltaproteobacteria bacterium]|nr:flippase-like domain-containing protein [Deltaproteobacteria bacterium]